nr:nuclear transport factor 2 family protein [Thioalkalivibrio sp.]
MNSPDQALAAYYAAFRAADIEAMMAVWAERPDIVCLHPGSQRAHRGVAEVMESWLLVFSRELNIRIEPKLVGRYDTGDLACLLTEELVTRPGDLTPTGSIFVSQAYRKLEHGWRLVQHHASHGKRALQNPAAAFVANGGGQSMH